MSNQLRNLFLDDLRKPIRIAPPRPVVPVPNPPPMPPGSPIRLPTPPDLMPILDPIPGPAPTPRPGPLPPRRPPELIGPVDPPYLPPGPPRRLPPGVEPPDHIIPRPVEPIAPPYLPPGPPQPPSPIFIGPVEPPGIIPPGPPQPVPPEFTGPVEPIAPFGITPVNSQQVSDQAPAPVKQINQATPSYSGYGQLNNPFQTGIGGGNLFGQQSQFLPEDDDDSQQATTQQMANEMQNLSQGLSNILAQLYLR